ncbi:MAG TPA: hypothetical protein VM690_10070 [Gaiellaceae bacterium]|nr:hypothetical protein [Gaiellaceae bacterium]
MTTHRPWRAILQENGKVIRTPDEARARHRELVFIHHPDRGGSHERMVEINAALERALAELGITR